MHFGKRTLALAALLGLTLATGIPDNGAAVAQARSAADLARLSSESDRLRSWQGDVQITMSGNGSTRTREALVSNKLIVNGRDTYRLYKFTSPSDIRGTSLLVRENAASEDDIWLYLPAAGKARRISAGAKKDSFAGTEFAYVDLMTQRIDKFDHALGKSSDGKPVVISTPKDDRWARSIGYSKQVATLDPQTYAATEVRYYDLKGRLLKTQAMGQFLKAGSKVLARYRVMTNPHTGRTTKMVFSDVVVNQSPADSTFSPQRLSQ